MVMGADQPALRFLAGGGVLGDRIAAFDWSATVLGPIEAWPASLCQTVGLMLRSRVPMVLLWGAEGIMIYNDAYADFAGGRDANLLGAEVRSGWQEVADFNDHVMKVGLAGGTLSYKNQQLTLDRSGRPEQVWMNLDYSPVPGDDGRPAGVIAIVVETTETHHAQRALEASETRLRFLDELGKAVSGTRDADAILAIATRMTGEHLGVSVCAYADMDEDEDGFTIRGDWHAAETRSIVGRYRLADFGTLAVAELGAGRPLIVNDNRRELAAHEAVTFQAIGITATICMPLVKQGRLTALMAIHDRDARAWNDYELTTIREVTERCWAHVERIRAEELLREREAQNRQILDSASDYAIIATDLDGRVMLWSRGAEQMLGWTEADMIDVAIERISEESWGTMRATALAEGWAGGEQWHRRRSGERFCAYGETTPLRSDRDIAIGFVTILSDRTDEHRRRAALRATEDQLRRAQEAGGVGLFSVDIANDLVTATPEFCRIFGFDPCGQLSTAALEALIIPEDAYLVSNSTGRRTATSPLDVEYRIRRADDGEIRLVARKGEYEFDDAGRPVRMVGIVQDITERRRIQLALHRSEAGFGALAQSMPNQVWTATAHGELDWFNAQVYAYSGIPAGELDAERWAALVHPEDREAMDARWQAAVAGSSTFETEFRARDAAGDYRWHLSRAVPLRDPQGMVNGWIGTNTDIHAQKLAEVAHAQERDRLWTLSQDLLLVCDSEGMIIAVNPSVRRMLGWDEAELAGRTLADFVHPDDLSSTAAELAALAGGGTTLAFENRYRTRDGDYRLIAWTAVPDGNLIHGVGRDITDQRQVEEALRQSQKMEAVGQLTGGIAHDFNNLLQGITGSLDLMRNRISQGRTGDLERFLTGAMTSAQRAAALTHRLLAFSRRQPLDPRPVKANPLVASMEDLLRRTLGERIELEMVMAGGLWLTRCDANQLESAILNLAINARDAMPDGGRLIVETCNAHFDSAYAARQRDVKPGQYVCICVTDTGTGMSQDVIAKAFEPFFTTKPIGQGTGLGLSMIYGFARQSEGYARIYSEVGKGTTVKLYLPRWRGEEEGEEAEAATVAPVAESGETVLVVEDEPVVRGLIVDVLGELGYNAIEAGDGPKGLEILQSRRRIDLLITDIGLPGLNGRQVADGGRVIRPGLKVLFMTGYAENAALASGFLEPGMAMVTKPFAMDILANRIREIIEER
ncbi:PAS domain S-box-containing protein [Sphingomonas zeicaulis]|uniref:PAS domain S-box protein n=1 Tax=Sphingomonas zeicaulis TaxID=1632740 RepID=UPI003D1C92A0